MPRKHDVNKINLQIDEVDFFDGGLGIFWSSDIGFGEYTILKDGKNLIGFSERMDIQEDKAFVKKLFELIAEKLIIKE